MHPQPPILNRKAFTLVELSIVIVIIGLIIAGVTAGKSLVRAAQLQSVINDMNKYTASFQAFKLQYGYFPGDLPVATNYWGTGASGSCPNGSASAGCNGNGDRHVDWPSEVYRFWQHLALANLVQGSYSGTSTTNAAVPGVNVPASAISGGGYSVGYGCFTGNTFINGGLCGNDLAFGAALANNGMVNPIINPIEANNIDVKIDDGVPSTGIIKNRMDTGPTCVSGANYNIGITTKVCAVDYRWSLGP